MEKPKVLSGGEIVAKGITKIDASLPEVGLKDVLPNGSWLEQKQIQAALEARKHLIEVERIEKCGTLSHAEWRDDLKLAEVTQKAGGHWQYLGHNVGKTLYLRPEEALFLMEVNCLILKHNEVTVSLQKAYSLLLESASSKIQYRVYASLSRLGYKVFKHKGPKTTHSNKRDNPLNELVNVDSPVMNTVNDSPTLKAINDFNVDSPNTQDSQITESNEETISKETIESEPDIFSKAVEENSNKIDSDVVMEVDDNVGIDTESVKSVIQEVPIVTESVSNEDKCLVEVAAKNADSRVNEAVECEHMDVCISQDTADSGLIMSDEKETDSTGNETHTTEVVNAAEDIKIVAVFSGDFSAIEPEKEKETENISTEESNPGTSVSLDVAMDSGVIISDEKETNSTGNDTHTTEVVNAAEDIKIVAVFSGDFSAVLPEKEKETENISTEESNPGTSVSLDVAMDSDSQNESENIKSEETAQNKDVENANNTTETTKETCNKNNKKEYLVYNYLSKIDKLASRKVPPSNSKNIQKYFDNIPDLFKKQIVTVNVPDKKYVPQDIFVNCSSYLVDLQYIKERSRRSASSESAYTSSDEVNGTNVRRIRSDSNSEYPQYVSHLPPLRNPVMARNNFFRSFSHWRPNNTIHYYQFNMIFQRPSFPNMFFPTRTQYHSRPNLFIKSPINNLVHHGSNLCTNARKRTRNGRTAHLQSIKNLAVRLKQIVLSGNTQLQSLECLHSLLHSYNVRYKSKLRLTNTFEVVNEERIIETIELDDDEESKSKRPRLDEDQNDKSDENLYRLRQFALRLKDLEAKDKATASHRRAISKAIKTYNKSYNADVYLNDNYEIIDRRYITLESTSESDCVVEEKPKPKLKSKKLRNPFNILKRRSERLKSLSNPGTSKDCGDPGNSNKTDQNIVEPHSDKYSEVIVTRFNEAWLPDKNDFGRAEVVPKHLMNVRLIDSSKEQFLYDFMKDQYPEHKNWLEAKISFMKHLRESNIAFQNEQARILADSDLTNKGLRPLIDSDDCKDMSTTMEKLRIIKSFEEADTETSLTIDFDVYNRDVQNFRKKCPPKPHFRIICLEESSSCPSAANITALHSQYEDKVAIVFAIVGIGSVSYIQINPIDLPVYTPKNDLV